MSIFELFFGLRNGKPTITSEVMKQLTQFFCLQQKCRNNVAKNFQTVHFLPRREELHQKLQLFRCNSLIIWDNRNVYCLVHFHSKVLQHCDGLFQSSDLTFIAVPPFQWQYVITVIHLVFFLLHK